MTRETEDSKLDPTSEWVDAGSGVIEFHLPVGMDPGLVDYLE